MPGIHQHIDPEGWLEYSVVFTDRSLNHMSTSFQAVMNNVSSTLKDVYQADAVALVPGGGTFGMESVARQFAQDAKVLVIRNGLFSFRWSQILERGRITPNITVLKAKLTDSSPYSPFAPPPLDDVLETIEREKPDVVFAPQVETSAGMLLPEDYLRRLGSAAKKVDALFVLDGIASGALWIDMRYLGVDVLINAPQKGWSASPCAAMVMLGERALERLSKTTSSSFSADLAKWLDIMKAYENGAHAYHATMPTDSLRGLSQSMDEAKQVGFDKLKDSQLELGRQVRDLLTEAGFRSVAAPGFEAPGVVVCYTDDAQVQNGSRFKAAGLQIAAGVPLQCDEPEWFQTFRIGLFGLDKLTQIDRTVSHLREALETFKP